MQIRHATTDDAGAIAAIYNHAVLHTVAILNDDTVDAANRAAWMAQRQAADFPVLVADQGGVVGYASYGPWRPHDGFLHTVEHSVYVAPDAQGGGIGRVMMTALIDMARTSDVHMMVAGIEAGNAGSIHLHKSLGFTQTAHMPEVGRKFDRWLDLVFMQLRV